MIQTVQNNGITWIDIRNPEPDDIKYLRENFHFHELILGELIPPGHRAKVETHHDYIFLILYYPAFNKNKGEISPRELDIIATKDHIITSHYQTIIPVKNLFEKINLSDEVKAKYMSGTVGHLIYYIIRGILENALEKVEHIERHVNYVEQRIFAGDEKEMVFAISRAKRDKIDFRRIIAPQLPIIDSLVIEGVKFFDETLQPHLDDLRGTFGILWNELQDHKETIEALAETNESILRTKTNDVIRILTIFSVIFLPLTLVASIWGMNIENLPLSGNTYHFYIVLGIMLSSLIAMLSYFKYRKWM